jgi:hypothetical protein
MKNPLRIFDYIYYRIVSFFLDKDLPVQDTAWANLALLQALTVLDIWIIVEVMRGTVFARHQFPYWIVFVLMGTGVLNWWRYTRQVGIRKLLPLWRNENARQRMRRGRGVVLYMVVAVLIAVTWGLVRTFGGEGGG